MSSKVGSVRGTQDMIGEQAELFHQVVAAFDRVRRLYGFERVEVPVIEATPVFARSLGETTDVVSKQMYTFPDLGGDSLTLRPEFTAGICRAYISNGWQQYVPLKVATHGPVFRYERPQLGRYRQFHQLDLEIIGKSDPSADVEILVVADQLLHSLGIKNVCLEINTLGDTDTRKRWRNALVRYFRKHVDELSADSQDRLERNPLRILDSKNSIDQQIAASAPKIDDFISNEAGNFFEAVKVQLQAAGVSFQRNPSLVRGLDYYRHTAFEFVTKDLGAQGTVLAGGRYDGLIEALGGQPTPAVGWAGGIERLMMLATPERPLRSATLVVESLSPEIEEIARAILARLRSTGMPTQIIDDGSLRKRFDRAVKTSADYIIVFLDSDHPNSDVGVMRVKRRIADRYKTRGRVFQSLRHFLPNTYGVDGDDLKKAIYLGGEVTLRRVAQ